MDVATLALNLVTARAQSLATSVAASLLKSDFGSEKAIAALLSPSGNGSAQLAAGIGGNLDVTA